MTITTHAGHDPGLDPAADRALLILESQPQFVRVDRVWLLRLPAGGLLLAAGITARPGTGCDVTGQARARVLAAVPAITDAVLDITGNAAATASDPTTSGDR